MGFAGPTSNVTLGNLTADVAQVIDALASGRAMVLGHASSTFVTKRLTLKYPDMILAIITSSLSHWVRQMFL